MTRYVPLLIAAMSAITMVAGFLDKDWSEGMIALTSVLGWVAVWECTKSYG